jgi:hypothetical protein
LKQKPDPETEPKDEPEHEKPDVEWELPLIHLTSPPISDRPGYIPPWEDVSHIELNIMDFGITHPMSVDISPREQLRAWWHDLLREYGRFYCYGIFLMLEADTQALSYVKEYAFELNQASGKNCAILGLGEIPGESPAEFDKKRWCEVACKQVEEGNSLKIAEIFHIPLTKFPGLILFRDIRSPEYILVNLKGLSAAEIAEKMRGVYQAINQAAHAKKDPLAAVSDLRRNDEYRGKTRSIISGTRKVAGQTLETVIEAMIKAVIKEG